MNTQNATDFEAALKVCASEPIHLIGKIQSHGQLLAFTPESPYQIRYATPSTWLTKNRSAEILGLHLSEVCSPACLAEIVRLLANARSQGTANGQLTRSKHDTPHDLLAHVYFSNGLGVLELEEALNDDEERSFADLLLEAQQEMLVTDAYSDTTAYIDQIAQLVRKLTGFDSVMAYRFDADWNGQIIAQHRADYAPSYLGMHFPASDIPPQARQLYTTNLVRMVADIDAEPLTIQAQVAEGEAHSLDLSFSALRSLSPIHIEYLKNIGVRASLTISLLRNGRLWGLIACHHMQPKRTSMSMREAAIFLSRMVSVRFAAMEALEQRTLADKTFQINAKLLRALPMQGVDTILDELLPDLQDILGATAVVVTVGNQRYLHGETPDEDALNNLLTWLKQKPSTDLFSTNYLSSEWQDAAANSPLISGVLATPNIPEHDNRIVWLRKEKPRTINWAGRYEEGFIQNAAGEYRLTPRKSFALWTEAWQGRAEPWRDLEIGIASMLALSLPESLAQKQRLETSLTRQKQTEEALRQHRDQLEETVKVRTDALSIAKEAAEAANRAKSAFLANMSHELRTPMNGIMGMIRLAMRKVDEPATVIDRLTKAETATLNLLNIIDDLLDITKIEADRMVLEQVEFSLAEIIENVKNLLAPKAAEKGLNLTFSYQPELAEMALQGDPLRLGQIVLNLVSNAVKFTSQGKVECRALLLESDPNSVLLKFMVTDEGIGIAPENHQRIFTPFEQEDSSITRKHGGTGLGLAICKRLAHMMGGDIGLMSVPGNGSTFWFTAKLLKPASTLPARLSTAPLSCENEIRNRHTGKWILVAEDDPLNQEVTKALLEDVGLCVDIAENGQRAIEMLRAKTYALVLMDMQMPGMGGIEATQIIRQTPALSEIPILSMTANAYDENHKQCLGAGMNDFIAKPVNVDEMFATLLRWL